MTIQQMIKMLKDILRRVEALEKSQVVPEVEQVATVVPDSIQIPDAPVAFEGARRGRPRKIVEPEQVTEI